MPDSSRQPIAQPDEAALRDSQIDGLLEDGLDRYFAGRYEDAIHLWTRVLFLDRSHARARAYIDRARTAIAESQRRSEELLQAGRDLLDQGQTAAAREKLAEAVAGIADDMQAAALRARLDRIERARALGVDPPARAHVPVETVPGWSWRRTPRWVAIAAGIVVFALGAALVVWVDGLERIDQEAGLTNGPVTTAQVRPEPMSSSTVALVRARTLFSRGRLSEALVKLDGVAPGSPERAAADALRIEIHQLLLASVRQTPVPRTPEAPR